MIKERSSFTLVELLIVITIIGILAVIGIARYGNVQENARSAEAFAVLSEILAAERRYQLDNDTYTATITNLDSFEVDPSASSENFTFTVPNITADGGYAQAARKANRGSASYALRFKDSMKKTCAGDTCSF